MKKQRNLISVLCIICMLVGSFVPVMKVHAATLEELVDATVAFGEYDQIDLYRIKATTLKVVLKEKGYFVLDFTPTNKFSLYSQLYDEHGNLLLNDSKYGTYGNTFYYGYNDTLEAGTYYLKLWLVDTFSGSTPGTYTYFARQVVSKDTSIEICIDLEVGKSIQLGTILNNSKDKDMKWSSSKKKVATVSSKGKVKAVKKGTTVIKVYNSSGLISKLKIRVNTKK